MLHKYLNNFKDSIYYLRRTAVLTINRCYLSLPKIKQLKCFLKQHHFNCTCIFGVRDCFILQIIWFTYIQHALHLPLNNNFSTTINYFLLKTVWTLSFQTVSFEHKPCKTLCLLKMLHILLFVFFHRKHEATSRILEDHSAFKKRIPRTVLMCVIYAENRVHSVKSGEEITCCRLQIRPVFIFNNTKAPQIPSINTVYVYCTLNILRVVLFILINCRYLIRTPATYLTARPTSSK
jgi:hypothetical protein